MDQLRSLQQKHLRTIQFVSQYDLNKQEEYDNHAKFVFGIGNNYLSREFREFELDVHNKKVLRFLLYYFNNCPLAENVFENENYKLHKNILLVGGYGTGKTIIMQVFSDYLKLTDNPNHFQNLSVTQMMNYYKINGHIDRYAYNELGTNTLEGNPLNLCLNDIGLETENQKSYGTSLDTVMDEFLYARYEIFQQFHYRYHLTSNLSVPEFQKRFENRLIDRFKSFNVIALTGESRRR